MTTEPTETEALLKKDASASPEPNAKSARVGGYVKAGLALAGVLGVCALGRAFEGNLVDAYRAAVGGDAARLAWHARPAHHYISNSNRPGGLFNTCEGKCPAVSVDFDAVTHEPGHAADRAAHPYLTGDTTDRLWHDGFCNDMLTSTERCPYRCAMPEPAALPGNVVPVHVRRPVRGHVRRGNRGQRKMLRIQMDAKRSQGVPVLRHHIPGHHRDRVQAQTLRHRRRHRGVPPRPRSIRGGRTRPSVLQRQG